MIYKFFEFQLILASVEDHLEVFVTTVRLYVTTVRQKNLTVVTSDGGDKNLLFHMICMSCSH